MRFILVVILLSVLCVCSIVLIIGTRIVDDDTENTLEMRDDKKEPSALYRDRADLVSKTCGKYKREIADRYKRFWPKENPRTVMGRAEVLVNRNVGFLWCRVPKAASESWAGVFIKKW